MRFVITDGTPDGLAPQYAGRTTIIEDWFVEKQKLPQKAKEAVLLRLTEKAMLFRCKDTEFWVPRSLIKFVERKERELGEF